MNHDHGAPRIDLTLDCARPVELAAFWKLALGYEDEPPPDPFATRQGWLTSHGVPEADWDKGAWLRDPAGVGPRLSLLEVPEPKVVKNRLHIDVRVAGDGPAEDRWAQVTETAERLAASGGSVVASFPGHHIVMADPEGNEFCVC